MHMFCHIPHFVLPPIMRSSRSRPNSDNVIWVQLILDEGHLAFTLTVFFPVLPDCGQALRLLWRELLQDKLEFTRRGFVKRTTLIALI